MTTMKVEGMSIDILYADKDEHGKFVRRRIPLEQIASLPLDNVLCIVLFEGSTMRWRFYENDNYVIGFVGDRYFVDWYDDGDVILRIRSVGDKHWQKIKYNRFRPTGSTVYTFTGGYVSPPEWKKALEFMEKEMR